MTTDIPSFIINHNESLVLYYSNWLVLWIVVPLAFLAICAHLFVAENCAKTLKPKGFSIRTLMAITYIACGLFCLFASIDILYVFITQKPALIITAKNITQPGSLLSRAKTLPWNKISSITVFQNRFRRGAKEGIRITDNSSQTVIILNSDDLSCSTAELYAFLLQLHKEPLLTEFAKRFHLK
ncbi:TPA: hypothetical protein DDZ86_00535 [Candidatus Dependentiae bacterium]|nr:MAG: hypothetical protein UW09_C0002G0017 [candidate division TM6 bacterium GW2011_GWF2_43_87]HBL98114.1 hypothetical protein [Candidatus Dependentiae bacterium]